VPKFRMSDATLLNFLHDFMTCTDGDIYVLEKTFFLDRIIRLKRFLYAVIKERDMKYTCKEH